MAQKADVVADLVLNTFRNLPSRCKPRIVRRKEWVPIAGIVLSRDNNSIHRSPASLQSAECVALATGMKCHPHRNLPQLRGNGLHDSHAEILALRAFNRFLLRECAELAIHGLDHRSKWLQWQRDSERLGAQSTTAPQPFQLRDDVAIHMYCSEAPCGDASMELTMAKQEDATPWPSSSSSFSEDATADRVNETPTESNAAASMHGRGHFNLLGTVRRKPSRADAPPSLSKSCTDKLAMKQCTGLLSSLTAQLIWPGNVYLADFTVPRSEYVAEAWERAFAVKGRMKRLVDESVQTRWGQEGFAFRPFRVGTTEREFEFSKGALSHSGKSDATSDIVPSNRSCVYISPHRTEVLINGVLEGRKWTEARGASSLSRRRMWQLTLAVGKKVGMSSWTTNCEYGELKRSKILRGREQVKADVRRLALQGWRRNDGDDNWTLEPHEWAAVDSLADFVHSP